MLGISVPAFRVSGSDPIGGSKCATMCLQSMGHNIMLIIDVDAVGFFSSSLFPERDAHNTFSWHGTAP